ncbi:CBN-SRV-34 protein [Caenorhabditis brenneri]|uniref:CBN-SRV-34 protein n=1 Tax=Caenorhabditis brenneri TaxID=135651 RepID=G0PK84_CAEBE|nr:CBN-SRV-34 protein [Caenorhabditis brenneri]
MLTPTWQMDFFIFETLILIPIYIFILIGFVVSRKRHKTFQSPYYTLMISQGLADISAIVIFSSLIAARYFSFGNILIYSLSPGSAYAYTNSGPFMFTLRGVGVVLITTQRYLTVCRSHGVLNYQLNHCPPLLLGIGHWFLAFLIYLPALLHTDTRFENEITLLTIASRTHLQYTSITVMGSYLVACITVIFMYSQIAVVMIRARKVDQGVAMTARKTSKKLKDARLTLHVFILVIFCIIAFFFYIGEYVLAFDDDVTRVRAFRLYYPTVSGNLSFINPIMLLALNKDVQSAFCCRIKKPSSTLTPIGGKRNGKSTTS